MCVSLHVLPTEKVPYSPENGTLTIRYVNTPKQSDTNDCGLFAIASATAIAFGSDPSNQIYCQGEMRPHLHQRIVDTISLACLQHCAYILNVYSQHVCL